MAFNRRNVMQVSYNLKDKEGRSSQYQFYIGELTGQLPNPNEAEFQAYIDELGSSLTNVTDCYVESVSVSMQWVNDAAIAFGPAPDVERKAVILYRTASGYSTKTSIPGAKYAMFGSDGESVVRDPANPDSFDTNTLATHLNSIADKMKNGVTINLATHPVTDYREDDVVSIKDAYKQHVARNRG